MLSEILLNVQRLSIILEIPFVNFNDHCYVNKYVRKIIPTDDIFKVKPFGKNKILARKIIQKIMEENLLVHLTLFLTLAAIWEDLTLYVLLIKYNNKFYRILNYEPFKYSLKINSIKFIKILITTPFVYNYWISKDIYHLHTHKMINIYNALFFDSHVVCTIVKYEKVCLLNFLHYRGINLMFNNYNLLSLASETGSVETLKFLLKIGDYKNAKKVTPLFKACYKNRVKVVKILLTENGSNLHEALNFVKFVEVKKLLNIFREV